MNNEIINKLTTKYINSLKFKLPQEKYYGNKEYKLILDAKFNKDRKFEKFITQMQFRLVEGNGIAHYFIGVWDNGRIGNITNRESIEIYKIINRACGKLDANIIKIYKFRLPYNIYYMFKIKSDKVFEMEFFR